MQIVNQKEDDQQAVTTLNGEVQDQAALMGVLNTLYQLQMNILSVNCEPCHESEANHLASLRAFEVTTIDSNPKKHHSNHKPGRAVMLVLSRKENESIVINGSIKIVVTAIQKGKVRPGIDAPQDVPVHRQEVYKLKRDTTEEVISTTALR